MSISSRSRWSKFSDSNLFTNLISLFALGISLFVFYKTELSKGKLIVSPPRRAAIASRKEVALQGNNSDKLLLSYSLYNKGATLKTIKKIQLIITTPDEQTLEFIADSQWSKLKNIELFEFPLRENEDYSLITAISIAPRSVHEANHLFFYYCDEGWHSDKKLRMLDCPDKSDTFEFESGQEYSAMLKIDTFEAKSQTICFDLVVPQETQTKVLDFSSILQSKDCP